MLRFILLLQVFKGLVHLNVVQHLILTFYSKTGAFLDIYEGQVPAILGHGGAGKSTLLNILSGLTVCEHIILQNKLADKTGSPI